MFVLVHMGLSFGPRSAAVTAVARFVLIKTHRSGMLPAVAFLQADATSSCHSIFHVPRFWKIIMTAARSCRLLKKHTVSRPWFSFEINTVYISISCFNLSLP